jgi:hypothetical protein
VLAAAITTVSPSITYLIRADRDAVSTTAWLCT